MMENGPWLPQFLGKEISCTVQELFSESRREREGLTQPFTCVACHNRPLNLSHKYHTHSSMS